MSLTVKVRIPNPLRKLTSDQTVVESQGSNIAEVLAYLEKNYPGIRERLCDETGQVRKFINIYLDGKDIRSQEGIHTKVHAHSEISIIPAIAGG